MAKIPLTHDQLEAQLIEQLGFLQRSCDSFDRGHFAEAKRLAVAIRILLHDTRTSHSLLGQLGKRGVDFYDTLTPLTGVSLIPEMGLIVQHLSKAGAEYVAPLDNSATAKTTPFEEWWAGTICRMPDGTVVSRSSLVLTASNQDGGAHVDPSLDELYHRLVHENALGYLVDAEGLPSAPMGDPTKAALRQIAHEVLKTLVPNYGKSFLPTGMMISGLSVSTEAPAFISEIHHQGPNGARTPPDAPCPCGSGSTYKGCHDKS